MDKSLKIGLLTSMPDENYTGILINGVASACRDKGICLNIYSGNPLNSPYLNEREQNAIYNFVDDASVDGLIISTASLFLHSNIEEGMHYFEKYKSFPVVSIGLSMPGTTTLEIDNYIGMKSLVSHMIKDHRFNKTAFVGGPIKSQSAKSRLKAYKDVLEENGLEYNPENYLQGDFNIESGTAAVRELIDIRKKQVEAIICANDEMAYGVIKELQTMGYHVPRDIAVTGYDNAERFRFVYPSFTTVMHPLYEQGYKSVEVLLDKMKGIEHPDITLLPPKLIIRESCGCTNNLLSGVDDSSEENYCSNISTTQNYEDLKHYLFQEVLENCNYGIIHKNQLSIIIDQLLSNLLSDLFAFHNYSKFIEYISESLSNENARIFHEVVNITYKVCTQIFKDKLEMPLVDKYFIHALSIMTEHFRSNQTQIYWKMRQLNDGISSKENLKELLGGMSNDFSKIIGLRTFYVSFYYDELKSRFSFDEAPTRLSKLVLAYNKDLIELDDQDRIFTTKKLLPEKLEQPGSIILFNLCLSYMDNHYGFITFEYNENIQKYFEFIQEQLSIALDTMNLIDRIKKEKDFAVSLQKKAEKQLEDFLTALGSAIESKDNYTGGHVERVGLYSRDIARKLELSEEVVREIYLGAIVHDVGKIGIKDQILNKPGKLTLDETKHMQQHPEIGKDILSKIENIETAIQIAYCHQERYDGSGYPNGLKGSEIPLSARIAAIADYWDAITTERPYRNSMSLKDAIGLMQSESGRAFEPSLLSIFMDSEDKLYLNYVSRDKLKELA